MSKDLDTDEFRISLSALSMGERRILETIVGESQRRKDLRHLERKSELGMRFGAFPELPLERLGMLQNEPFFLTFREVQVLKLLLDDKSNKDVGRVLSISPRTAEVHRSSIYAKLGVTTTVGMTRSVIGLLVPSDPDIGRVPR